MGVLDYTTVTPPGFPEGYNVENVPGGGYLSTKAIGTGEIQ